MPEKKPVLAADTGGTFTDLVLDDGRTRIVCKLPTTPDDPSRAILDGVGRLDPERRAGALRHGTTVALNALLMRRGARTALVTNRGFPDLIEIGRGHRAKLYDLDVERETPLVPRSLRFEVDQRTTVDGREDRRPSRAQIDALVARLERAKPESIAVLLLHAYANPEPEVRLGRALAKLGVPVSLSSAVLPRFREVERFSTTVLNAYLVPIVGRYLERLEARLEGRRLELLQNGGGLIGAGHAAQQPVEILLSGPAGGVVGGSVLATRLGHERALTLDMGGTSTDVCVAGQDVAWTTELELGGFPMALPSYDLHTIGCGGGSIAWVDAGGALKVGPHSAGADPGPAAYGNGDEPTVTDAHVVLGRLPADHPLAGALPLDRERAIRVFEKLAKRLGTTLERAAQGALAVADAAMVRALKVITLERGLDPTRYPLIAFGGAGGLHAARLVQALRLPGAIVPRDPGAFSALGMLDAPRQRTWTRTVNLTTQRGDAAAIDAAFGALEEEARAALAGDGAVRIERLAELRYRGQSHELLLPWRRGAAAAFHRDHESRYGFRLDDEVVEVVHVGVRATVGRVPKPRPLAPPRGGKRPRRAPVGRSPGSSRIWPVIDRVGLAPGELVAGPAIVTEYSGTTIVEPGFEARVDAAGHLHMTKART